MAESADTLREAAWLMGERARAATPGPWIVMEGSFEQPDVAAEDGHRYVVWEASNFRDPDAEHIASWHPGVALAVADFLDLHSSDQSCDHAEPVPCLVLAVARAYLGGEA